MAGTLYPRATHRAGPLLWSGVDERPKLIENLRKDMDLELARCLEMRSSVFEPCRIGLQNSVININGVCGNGFRTGSSDVNHIGHVDLATGVGGKWGTQKDGSFHLRSSGSAVHQHVETMGPPAFEAIAGKDLKFYFKGSLSDVSTTDSFVGMAHDDTINHGGATGGATYPTILTPTSGAFVARDGIGFLKAAGAAAATMTFAVWDANSSTNSSQTVTFPATIDDDVEFECGFIVHGVTAITVFMKVGTAETVQLITRVAGTTLDLLTASLKRLACAASIRIAASGQDDYLQIKAMSATQPM